MSLGTDVPTLVALLVCLIPTTIGALLAAIGIAGMDRALRANIIAKSGKAVEVAGDVDTLLLDKTGTITVGNRRATQFVPFDGLLAHGSRPTWRPRRRAPTRRPKARASSACFTSSTTPRGDGRLAATSDGLLVPPECAVRPLYGPDADERHRPARRSADSQGAPGCHPPATSSRQSGRVPAELDEQVAESRRKGPRRCWSARATASPGWWSWKTSSSRGSPRRFERLRRMGLRTVMVTGDNPLTAAAIAATAGVDDFIAEATPEAKLAYIRKEQAEGKLVAMMGDGTNDAPALAQADVGVAMNSGTQAAKEAGNMVDLDSDPTKLIEVVEIGKQLLMTRGALTTFSIANDVAKYFAIVPALFAATLPWLKTVGHHEPALGHLGDPLGGDLQRDHHSAVDPDRAEGSEVSPGRGRRPAAPQPADLGAGRRDRAVCRHQTDRHDPGCLALGSVD